eukprot:scaffold19957_cov118-Isochrysis_galbana.AAC.1
MAARDNCWNRQDQHLRKPSTVRMMGHDALRVSQSQKNRIDQKYARRAAPRQRPRLQQRALGRQARLERPARARNQGQIRTAGAQVNDPPLDSPYVQGRQQVEHGWRRPAHVWQQGGARPASAGTCSSRPPHFFKSHKQTLPRQQKDVRRSSSRGHQGTPAQGASQMNRKQEEALSVANANKILQLHLHRVGRQNTSTLTLEGRITRPPPVSCSPQSAPATLSSPSRAAPARGCAACSCGPRRCAKYTKY